MEEHFLQLLVQTMELKKLIIQYRFRITEESDQLIVMSKPLMLLLLHAW
jgi:hypothetical protein